MAKKLNLVSVIIFLLCGQVLAQADRTVLISKKADIKKELFKYLVVTKQASRADEYKAMYQVDLVTKSSVPGVAIYKFGIQSAHADYNVVFRYRDRLVFPSVITTGHLFTLFGNFLTQYPGSFNLSEQKQLAESLFNVIEHRENLAKQDELPDKTAH